MSLRWALLVVAMAFGLAAPASAEGISGIVVATDRSVNCATVKTIVADVTAGAESDRDKAVADGRVSENFMFNPAPDIKTVKGAKGHRPGRAGSGVKRCRYKENLSLRPGESCTWMWDHVGKWYWPGERFACPAFKFAGDRACKQAFPFWEPYRKRIPKGPHPWNDVYYRYHCNAILVCQPPLTRGGLADVGAKCTNVAFGDGGIRPDKPGDATVEIAFALPYAIADSQIEGVADLGQDATIRIGYSLDGGKTWLACRSPVQAGGRFGPVSIGKPNSREYPADSTSGQYAYALRLTLARGAALKSLKISNTTMLNSQSRPWLETGKNKVTVAVGDGDLAATPLEIRWRWLEDWTDEKSFTHKVNKSGQQATIEVGGHKRPKMKSVTIACSARYVPWRPASATSSSARTTA